MTAELAVVLPAVLLVLAACLGALRTGVEEARLVDAAALAARSLGRGDPPADAEGRARLAGAQGVTIARRDGLVCARATAVVVLLAVPVPLAADSCALDAP